MNALGKYCHDFPRLAKESGYNFQLYRGRINWNDIEEVDIQEIIDNRNFRLLEQNLIHVINCNLDRDYDVKILDQNFVKLFKLAQLGIDYLSYCELYLDRCVVLLQEQLSSYQVECAQLKEENEKKEEELKKSRKRVKQQSQNYKCIKCEKLFLNEAYLESHNKRRHGKAQEAPRVNAPSRTDQGQQTEQEKKSVLTQTLSTEIIPNFDMPLTEAPEVMKMSEQELKIDNLKRDLEELKLRLSLAEKTMEEKKNGERTFQSGCGFPSTVIPVIHSYIPTPSNGYVQMNPAPPTIVPGVPNKFLFQEVAGTSEYQEHAATVNQSQSASVNPKPTMYGGVGRQVFRDVTLQEPPQRSVTPERVCAESSKVNQNPSVAEELVSWKQSQPDTPPQRPYVESEVVDLKREKLKPNGEAEESRDTPKRPKSLPMLLEVENLSDFQNSTIGSSPVRSYTDLKFDAEYLSEPHELRTSTPVKTATKQREEETTSKSTVDVAADSDGGSRGPPRWERKTKSLEMPVKEMNFFEEEGEKPKSLLKKIVTKKTPKIQELTVNFRNSFSNLYGSIGRRGEDVVEANLRPATKSDVVEGLHGRLKELGIDPEWSGIPKETMKQKMKILQHNRNLLSKENRLYPFLRRKLEKHVLKKLKSKSLLPKGKPETTTETPSLQIRESSGDTDEDAAHLETSKEIIMYDSDRDSDIEILDSNRDREPKSIPSPAGRPATSFPTRDVDVDKTEPTKANASSTSKEKEEERETDFSIFQVGRYKEAKAKVLIPETVKNSEKPRSTVDELETDSDFEDELLKEFGEHSTKGLSQHITKTANQRQDTIGSFPVTNATLDSGIRPSSAANTKIENQSILKNEADKSNVLTKKKVLFADRPEIFNSMSEPVADTFKISFEKKKIQDATSLVDDDDDWSIESEWTVNDT